MIDIHSKLSGRYLITDTIGSGGMANVYLAHDLILDRDVAVKVLKYDFQDNQDAIRRFQREAMAASQLLHQNIVEVYDVDEEDGQQYIVMEFVKGTDLKTFIKAKSPISLELVVNIMSQILSAIEVAHKNGIIHRDIKPQNILITDDNEVKITDFGIAIALTDTSLTQTNTLLGSVHYLSPEQARGGNATIKSDIYALGVVLFELITGEVPYDGESAVSVALKHFQEDFPLVRDKLDYVPQSLENVVLRATSKSLEDRYPSSHSMLTDLSTSLNVNRMHERPFDLNAQSEEAIDIKSIRPISSAKQTLSSVEIKSDFVGNSDQDPSGELQTYDTIPPITKPKRQRKLLTSLLILALITLVGFGLFYLYDQAVRFTNVPVLHNLPQSEAIAAIEEAGLTLGTTTHSWHATINNGNVISSDPRENSRVDRTVPINLVISSGKEQVEIGNYLNQDYERVRQLLLEAGFIVERNDMYTNELEAVGKILGQSIEAGSRVIPESTSITLTVGNYSETSTMQDFYNLSVDMAQSFANSYGLNIDVAYEYSDFIPEGQILSQSPNSGVNLYPGDTISVVVSMGQEEEEILTTSVPIYLEYVPLYADNDREQENALPNTIRVYLGDLNNNINQLAEEFEIRESQTIQLTLYIPANGTGQYRVVRNGEVIEESNEVYPGE